MPTAPAPAATPAPKPAPAVAEAAPPEKLPAHLLPSQPPPGVQQAAASLPLAVGAGVSPLEVTQPVEVSGEVFEVQGMIGTLKLKVGNRPPRCG